MDVKGLSHEVLQALIDQLQDPVYILRDAQLVYFNDKLTNLIGVSEQELLSRSLFAFVHPDDLHLFLSRYQQRLTGAETIKEYGIRLVTASGETKSVFLKVDLVNEGDTSLVIGSMKDVTETLAYRHDLAAAQKDIMNILDNLPDIFYRTDADGNITYLSPSIETALGYKPEECYGKPIISFYANPSDRDRLLEELERGQGVAKHFEAYLVHKDGHKIFVSTNAYIRKDEQGRPIGVEGLARDITHRKEMEERLVYLSNHDQLTGLPLRGQLFEFLNQAIKLANRDGRLVAVMFCDLDNFKEINDAHSHEVGDQVLISVAKSMKAVLRESDIVGRLGGDEFVVIAQGLHAPEAARQIAQKIIQAVAQTAVPACVQELVGVSVGIALYPSNTQDAAELLRLADMAMYRSKEAGSGVVSFW